jgi:imidazolonepropionase-like amidohydrolase
LAPNQALAALTTIPAAWLGLEGQIGTLEVGKLASFSIYNGNPFTHEAQLLESWNQGAQKVWKTPNTAQIIGTYTLRFENQTYGLQISGTPERPQAKAWLVKGTDTLTAKANVILNQQDIALQFLSLGQPEKQLIQLHGKVLKDGAVLEGEGTNAQGAWIRWSAIQNKKTELQPLTSLKPDTLHNGAVWFPNMAFGNTEVQKTKTILFKDATVWTNEKEGILVGADVLVQDGKIIKVSRQSIAAPAGARVVDAKGLHLTSGIIDEHSHIAAASINEGGQSVTSEVRIGDNLNPDYVNIYRQLSGGVTTSHILHGSANVIGGQTQLIKLRWGGNDEDLKFRGWTGQIKFALGENVKRSSSPLGNNRYPDTRMGVEQVLIDAFTRAKDYQKSWNAYNATKGKKGFTGVAPRRDLELDALVEILEKKRFITCHSYVQSEINSAMKVAEQMGYTVNTFTHILEGYKVADKMLKHGSFVSTFSDGWAYKMEVEDASPYNAAIMQKVGLTVAINSDDAEMARRLNQEAAKIVKYGGVTEEEALKMVTLNPAKMLHLDKELGTIESGKSADLVLWSGHPLSVYSRAEKTIIDGMIYFSREQGHLRDWQP